MDEADRMRAELELAEAVLRGEANQLQELAEKRRLVVDGLSEISAPSEMWEQYLEEIDDAIATAQRRIEALCTLCAEMRARSSTRQ